MHWSSSLERRFIPGDARIIGDLCCPKCDYSLRGLEALGRCPECGRPVLDAIRPIPEPKALAKAFGEAGWAFVTLLVVIVLSLVFGPVTAGVGVLLLAVLAGFRAFAAAALAAALRSVPNEGCRDASRVLIGGVAIEFVPIAALLVVTIVHSTNTAATWPATVAGFTPLALTLVAMLQLGLVADVARRVGRWLELERMEQEARWSLWLTAIGATVLLLGAAATVGGATGGAIGGVGGLAGLFLLVVAVILATRSLWRAAAAIPRIDESPEALIDRPMMSPAELKERGLLTRPKRTPPAAPRPGRLPGPARPPC